ncbi:MAG: RdgB/HAM1 family non-canonical purine NTP pyrophosphatase [Acidobacteriota bacterium]
MLVLATHNPGKLREMARLAPDLASRAITLADAGVSEEAPESGSTFEENARMKASHYGGVLRKPTLAEDSGLCVDALGGGPGVLSARFLPELAYPEKNLWLAREVSGRDRRARYVSVFALWLPAAGIALVARGEVEGEIAAEPRGTEGFGYDPVFLVPSLGKTFGEMTPSEKDALSHRRRALDALREKLAARREEWETIAR